MAIKFWFSDGPRRTAGRFCGRLFFFWFRHPEEEAIEMAAKNTSHLFYDKRQKRKLESEGWIDTDYGFSTYWFWKLCLTIYTTAYYLAQKKIGTL